MDAKPHYFRIGIFVLIAVVLIITAIVLFGAGLFAQNKIYVESYFAESITGLSVGSLVEFRGVRIGQVESIGFVGNVYKLEPRADNQPRYASYVRVVSGLLRAQLPGGPGGENMAVVFERMVEHGLRVRVASNILTQQAYLELNFLDPNRFPVEPVPWQPEYPVIPSAPSEFTTIKDSLDRILTQMEEIDVKGLVTTLNRVFTSLNTAITEADLAQLSLETRALLQVARQKLEDLEAAKINAAARQFLDSLNRSVTEANIPALSRQMRDVLTTTDRKLTALDTQKLNADLERVLGALDQAVTDANVPALSAETVHLVAELRKTNEYLQVLFKPPAGVTPPPNVPAAVERLDQTLAHLNELIVSERPALDALLSDFRAIVNSLNELITSLEQNPSALLFSRPPGKSEVVK
jgi:ABC-type transporter Mla subunit MlaD